MQSVIRFLLELLISDANVGLGGYGFTANPNQYFTPSTPSLPSSIDLAFTDKMYKFPQVWKTTIALDQRLPFVSQVPLKEFTARI
jgi:hypothetical protein